MSGTEDYLDGLLNSLDEDAIPQDREAEREPGEADLAEAANKTRDEMEMGEDYLDSLGEGGLSGDGGTDDFIRQFEEELAQESAGAPPQDDALFDSLDGIVSSVKERMRDDEFQDDDIMVDTIGDLSGDEFGIPSMGDDSSASSGADEFGMDDPEFAELFRTDGELPDIEELLGDDFGDDGYSGEDPEPYDDGEEEFPADGLEEFSGMDGNETYEEIPDGGDSGSSGRKDKKSKKKEKSEKKDNVEKKENGESSGFLKKLSNALFEESGEDELPAGEGQNTEQMSDENLQILQQMEGGDTVMDLQQEKKAAEEEKKKKKEEAKKARREKKEQAKREREAKKKSRPKKEKKPKEPDKSKPLPKKPVILIYAMAASFLALVLLGIKYSGYAGSKARAAGYYSKGAYREAYLELSGLEIADDDQGLYEKYRILANTSGEYSAYRSFMDAEIYDMALDSLIRTVGRCGKYLPDAQEYGCSGELNSVKDKAVAELAAFGVSEERAAELYAQEDRSAYSAELYAILAEAGYVTE